ncbi:hypothetical protein CLU79DRAFT_760328 [Phycomyces nitens]|nr:hypothetical protein CLU79DRAFT_760328 [Phycomyces nitens]
MSSSLEETKAMIQQVEELIALAPTDDSLLTMLADLYDVLEKAMAEQPKEQDAYQCGTKCVIPFSLNDRQYLLPALVLERPAQSDQANVLILTPITADTVACTDHLVKHTCQSPCPDKRSHGYPVPIEHLLPYDVLGISDMEHYKPSRRVWCKVDDATTVWQVGRIVGQGGSADNQWRVQCASDMSTLYNLGIESIMPYRIQNTSDRTGSENDDSDDENYVDGDNDSEHESDHELEQVDLEEFGGWQAHTNGFASKMMKKMGYISGKGLGLHGQGRIDPVEAFLPSAKKRSIPGQDRPGLGSNSEPPKKPKRPQPRLVDTSVFAFMNKTLGKPKEHDNPDAQDKGDTKGPRKPAAAITLNPKETQRQLHALQTEIAQTSETLARAHESVRRNKGTPMESQFIAKVDRVAKALDRLQKDADRLQGTLKRTKEREKMVSF